MAKKMQVISEITCYIWDLVLPAWEVVEISNKQLKTVKETHSFKNGKIRII